MKKLITTVLAAGMLLMMSVSAFAAESSSDYNTPAEIVAGLTDQTVESVIDQRLESGKTYGTLAKEAGKLEAFQAECLEMKKEALDAQVTAGYLTQAEADTILAAIEENQAICDGAGIGIGRANGAGYGFNGCGFGMGGGRGMGRGLRNGFCPIVN